MRSSIESHVERMLIALTWLMAAICNFLLDSFLSFLDSLALSLDTSRLIPLSAIPY